MERITEPELMDDVQQAEAYAQADFSESNKLFIEHLLSRVPELNHLKILDIGCGPGDICISLARLFPDADITGLDGSRAMIDIAKLHSVKLENPPCFLQTVIPDRTLCSNQYDIILSNSLLHHLHHPVVLWQTIEQLAKAGSYIQVMDLIRPETLHQAKDIVEKYAKNESEILKQDFYNSLRASFSINEVKDMLKKTAYHNFKVEKVSDRHLTFSGFHN